MSLKPGARLGPYEILAPLGAGGMGEVYRARDAKLARDVALKILAADLSDHPEALSRFEREVRAVAALSHPNILAVHDFGTDAGTAYAVMELLEGETLRERLSAGALPVRKAAEYAAQIARGMASAHEKGIVHRDLKPENLFITKGGHVKILDFGLARLVRPDGAPVDKSDSPTLTHDTHPGTVLGTVAYMSPEQVRGEGVDHRSDIFSFGAVLYEIVTGQRAFRRATSAETMSAILNEDPPELTETGRTIPPAVDRIIRHCLEKRPDERFQSARDLVFDLESLSGTSAASAAAAPVTAPFMRRRLWPVVAIASTVLSALLAVLLYFKPSGSDLSAYRFTPFATDPEREEQPAWSPDGRSIAYMKVVGGRGQIFVRGLDADSPVQLTHMTEDARQPFWWPDSSRIGFATASAHEVLSVGAAGGEPDRVQKALAAAVALSPDGKTLATWRITTDRNVETGAVWLASPPTSEPRKYTPAPFEVKGWHTPNFLRFSPDGTQILAAFYSPGVVVWLLPFPDGPGAHGKPHQIFKDAPLLTVPAFSWMPDSRHVVMAFTDTGAGRERLWMADTRAQTLGPLTAGVMDEVAPDVSPDGSKIAFTSGGGDFDLVDVPLDGSPVHDLLATSRNEHSAAWVPGAPQVVYITNRRGREEVRIRSSTESWDRPIVTQDDFPKDTTEIVRAPVVSPDGRQVAYDRKGVHKPAAIWISPITGGAPVKLVQTLGDQVAPTWSPDGKWLAFLTLEGGVMRLAKSRVGGTEPPQVLLEDSAIDTIPVWSPKGEWIAYQNREGVNLVSPDGKEKRLLAKIASDALVWSRDGAMIYAIGQARPGAPPSTDDPVRLISLAVKTGSARIVRSFGDEFYFGTPFVPGLRLTLAPDGRSFSATVLRVRRDLWLLEGFNARKGLLDWFR